MNHRLFSLGVAVTGLALAAPATGTVSQLPPTEHAGPVTFISGGTDANQADAMQRATASYPLELDFLWGRGAKETEIANVEWSIRNTTGQTLADARSTGPMVLASLPDGRYTVTATYDGKALTRDVTVQKGKHDRVVLEWPQ